MKKYVITAGPGNGKTTVIEILASQGYSIIPEAARLVIEEEKLKNSNAVPWIDLRKFQALVAQRQMELEASATSDIVFLDRSIIDGHAYCTTANIPSPQLILDNGRNRYEKVFLLSPLPVYKKDSIRLEDTELASQLHDAIILAYHEFGYELISVPALTPEERVDYILKHIS